MVKIWAPKQIGTNRIGTNPNNRGIHSRKRREHKSEQIRRSADRKRGQRKGATSKNVKNRQKYFGHFSTIFAQGKKRQKMSKCFSTLSTIFCAAPVSSGPFWGALRRTRGNQKKLVQIKATFPSGDPNREPEVLPHGSDLPPPPAHPPAPTPPATAQFTTLVGGSPAIFFISFGCTPKGSYGNTAF